MYICDFFNLSVEALGLSVDCVFDRASFVAIEICRRQIYADLILNLCSPNFKYLLIAEEYDETKMKGPPHNLRRTDVEKHFKNSS